MRYAILADIHANLAAFTAVLRDIENRGTVDGYWCLGDLINYGPEPVKCIELLRRLPHVAVAGNHDRAAAGQIPLTFFNPDAAAAMLWTKAQLNAEALGFLKALPDVNVQYDFTLVHGSPRDPVWEYLVSRSQAKENFACIKTRHCLVGHTHEPLAFRLEEDSRISCIHYSETLAQVAGGRPLILNPGSVGQPRDGDPRASYAVYDDESRAIRLYRIAYDIGTTQHKMVKENLPMRLVMRLEKGL